MRIRIPTALIVIGILGGFAPAGPTITGPVRPNGSEHGAGISSR